MDSVYNDFDSVYQEFNPLVDNILRNNLGHGLLSSDMDDVHQEVWSAIWQKAVAEGEYPVNQIAAITRNVLRDFIRKDIRANSITPQGYQDRVSFYGTQGDDEEGGTSAAYDVPGDDDFERREKEQDFQRFLDRYPEGTKEHTYIEYYLDKAYREGGKRYTDSELAQMLGWSGTSSGAWKAFKSKMQKEIADYFGYEPEEKEYAPRGRTKKD